VSASASTPIAALRESLAALGEGRLTATALVGQALQLAHACNEAVNAFSLIADRQAEDEAAQADRRYADGRAGPLEGLPIVVKDLIDTAGIETRYGSRAYLGHVPAQDADVVRRLKDAGAVVIGKATTHEFAWGVTTSHDSFGDTRNPHDTTRIPGGSSGGTAAAIASGAVAAGLGTDTGGSVRIPAALCGVAGFKPTWGALSTDGIFPLAPTLDHPGILGRSMDDVQLLAAALGMSASNGDSPQAARFGVISFIAPVPLESGVAAAFAGALARVGRQFACRELQTEGVFDGAFETFAGIVLAEGAMSHLARSNWDWIVQHYGAETIQRLTLARAVTLGEYGNCLEARRRFIGRLDAAITGVDFLLLPTCPCVAPLLRQDDIVIGPWSGTARRALMTYTSPFNLAGYPAITLPIPQAPGLLPAGLQIVARPGEDGRLLQIAQTLESMLAACS